MDYSTSEANRIAELEAILSEMQQEIKAANEFIDLVYEVYPNVDLDIDIYTKYHGL